MLPRRIIQAPGLSSARTIGAARSANSLASRSPPMAERGVGGIGEQFAEPDHVADVLQQRGGSVDALAQLGDGRRCTRLSAHTLGDLPLVACCRGALQRLVGGRVRGVGPAGDRPHRRASAEHLGRAGGDRRAARATASSLGEDRGLLGDAPAPSQATGLGQQRAGPLRRMVLRARQGQRLVDPVDRVARSGLAGPSSGRAPRPSRAPVRRRRGRPPTEGPRARLSISASSRARCSLRSHPQQRLFGSVALGEREVVAVVALADGVARRRRPRSARRRRRGSSRASAAGWARAPAAGARAGSWRRGGRACRGRRR